MVYKTGQKLGNYQLERFLGHGGFAEVYLGKHMYLNTHAAIKVLLKQSNAETLEHFLQEARMIAGLKHPHIVRILDFGIEEQHPFLVMAYAPHGTLRQRYSKGKVLSPATIAPHVRQIVDALHYAHGHKIIHRDVKPENMLLDDDNIVLLSDFGLAMREHSTYHSIHSTDSAGTTIYMAPEQLRGKPCAASDQYALGIVMYEWLCGCLPFDGPDISVVVQHLHETPAPLRDHVPTLPAEIESVVLKALEKNPQQRFATIQDLGTAFEEACKDIPLPETTPALSLKNTSAYRGSELEALQHSPLSHEFVELLPASGQNKTLPAEGALPAIPWPSHFSSLQAPSLSAPLNVNTSTQDAPVALTIPTPSPKYTHARISRKVLIAVLACVILLASGIGIWHFSSQRTGENLSVSAQNRQGNSGTVTSSSTATSQTSTTHTNGTPATGTYPGALPANSNTTGKNGGTTTPSTPSSSSNGNPAATSTTNNAGASSGMTPTPTTISTSSQNTGLTIKINNPPTSVQNKTTTAISVTTSMGNISFQFNATYSRLKNPNKDGTIPPDTINGTTNATGAGTISWTPSLPPGQVGSNTYATVNVVATDQNGNTIYSNSLQVQIIR